MRNAGVVIACSFCVNHYTFYARTSYVYTHLVKGHNYSSYNSLSA